MLHGFYTMQYPEELIYALLVLCILDYSSLLWYSTGWWCFFFFFPYVYILLTKLVKQGIHLIFIKSIKFKNGLEKVENDVDIVEFSLEKIDRSLPLSWLVETSASIPFSIERKSENSSFNPPSALCTFRYLSKQNFSCH